MNFDMRLKQGPIQTNLRDSNNFPGLKWVECRKWLKYPSIEIKCRERCNWSETVQMTYNARKEELNKYF